MMKYFEAFSLAISLLTFIAEMKREGGDKETALIGLSQLIAKVSGVKDEELGIIVPEIKKLFAAISALRSA